MMGTSDNPWAPAQERFNRNARMDRQQAMRLNALSVHQSSDDKLAYDVEAGRIYGLRQQKYDMLLKKQLNLDYRKPPVEHMW
jgi:hypothetical protein